MATLRRTGQGARPVRRGRVSTPPSQRHEPAAPTSDIRPALGSDVTVTPDTEAGYYIVRHPGGHRFFRVSERTAQALLAMDGTRTFDELRQAVTVSSSRLRELVEHLAELGLLDGQDAAGAGRTAEGYAVGEHGLSKGFRRIAFMGFDVASPHDGLSRIYRTIRLRRILGPPAMVGVVLVTLLAVTFAATRAEVVAGSLEAGFRPPWMWLAPVVFLIRIVVHESAHGLACIHYGGRLGRAGVGLLYLTPVCYVDVSDAWTFPTKAARVWVHSAGIVTDWTMVCLSLLVAATIAPSNGVAAAVMGQMIVFAGVSLFLNTNPLLKLDGYYVLSDALGIPNLRGHAFGILMGRVRALARRMGLPVETAAEDRAAAGARAAGYLTYAMLSLGYVVALFGFLAMRAGSRLDEHLGGPWRFVAYAVFGAMVASLIVMLFRGSLRRQRHTF